MTTYDAPALRTFRRYYGLSIRDLCIAINVNSRDVNRWENGAIPIPNHVNAALTELRDRIESHLEQQLEALAGHTTVTLYRDRGELLEAHPFYTDLPSSLHEWEVAILCDELDATATYTDAWTAGHAKDAA